MMSPYMERIIFAWQTCLILNGTDPIFKQGCFEVFLRDAKQILHGHFISTQVIDAILYILHCFNRALGATWNFVRCAHTATVPHMSGQTLKLPEYKVYRKECMTGSRWVIIPVQSIDHWFLVILTSTIAKLKSTTLYPTKNGFESQSWK